MKRELDYSDNNLDIISNQTRKRDVNHKTAGNAYSRYMQLTLKVVQGCVSVVIICLLTATILMLMSDGKLGTNNKTDFRDSILPADAIAALNENALLDLDIDLNETINIGKNDGVLRASNGEIDNNNTLSGIQGIAQEALSGIDDGNGTDNGTGNGTGYSNGTGSGADNDNGKGSVIGNGNGTSSSSGNGNGTGNGNGKGSVIGNSNGTGNGTGNDTGNGTGNGIGNGDGTGNGTGSDSGSESNTGAATNSETVSETVSKAALDASTETISNSSNSEASEASGASEASEAPGASAAPEALAASEASATSSASPASTAPAASATSPASEASAASAASSESDAAQTQTDKTDKTDKTQSQFGADDGYIFSWPTEVKYIPLAHDFYLVTGGEKRINGYTHSNNRRRNKHYVYITGRSHYGFDVTAAPLSTVHAAASGKVTSVSTNIYEKTGTSGYGKFIIITHYGIIDGSNAYTVYAHLDKAEVSVGDKVAKGDRIGLSGNSGGSRIPHVHFEIRIGGNNSSHTVDPLDLLPPLDFGKMKEYLDTEEGFKYSSVDLHRRMRLSEWKYDVSVLTAIDKTFSGGVRIPANTELTLLSRSDSDFTATIQYEGKTLKYSLDELIFTW